MPTYMRQASRSRSCLDVGRDQRADAAPLEVPRIRQGREYDDEPQRGSQADVGPVSTRQRGEPERQRQRQSDRRKVSRRPRAGDARVGRSRTYPPSFNSTPGAVSRRVVGTSAT
jgi:hypothetical protein